MTITLKNERPRRSDEAQWFGSVMEMADIVNLEFTASQHTGSSPVRVIYLVILTQLRIEVNRISVRGFVIS